MIPTLLVGDYLFVSKYSYGYSKHSFPFSMGLFSGRIFGQPPERGDVAVFKYPGDQGQGVNRTDYIKRIVGLPGDRIQVTNGVLHINGTAGRAPAHRRLREGHQRPLPEGHALQRDAAQRPALHGARVQRQRHGRQHAGVPGAGRQLLRHGRQPRQFARQPNAPDVARLLRLDARSRPARLVRARRKSGRPRRIHLLLARSVGRRLAGAVEMAAGRSDGVASSRRSTEA